MIHCWTDYADWARETYGELSPEWCEAFAGESKTCLLPDGHAGPHVWTPDKDMTVVFAQQMPEAGQ